VFRHVSQVGVYESYVVRFSWQICYSTTQQIHRPRRESQLERERTFPTPLEVPDVDGKTWTNSIGMEFVRIPPGTFMMGSPDTDTEAKDWEKPAHRVTISQPFYLGKYPVTQAAVGSRDGP
jgi:formylglycine-generating enzyme required for sulfatase activity